MTKSAEVRATELKSLFQANEDAVRRAVRQALIEHKQSGDPIVVCEGDVVRWIPADEIVIPDLPPAAAAKSE